MVVYVLVFLQACQIHGVHLQHIFTPTAFSESDDSGFSRRENISGYSISHTKLPMVLGLNGLRIQCHYRLDGTVRRNGKTLRT